MASVEGLQTARTTRSRSSTNTVSTHAETQEDKTASETTNASNQSQQANSKKAKSSNQYEYGASVSTAENLDVAALENAALKRLRRITNSQSELLNEHGVPQWDARMEDPIVAGNAPVIEPQGSMSDEDYAEYVRDQHRESRENVDRAKEILADAVAWEAERIKKEAAEREAAAIEASRAAGDDLGTEMGRTEAGYMAAQSVNTRGGSDVLNEHGVPQWDARMENPFENGAMGDVDSRHGSAEEVLEYYQDIKAEREADYPGVVELFSFENLKEKMESVEHPKVFLEAMLEAMDRERGVCVDIITPNDELERLGGP